MPTIHLLTSLTDRRNNIHVRRLDELIEPIIGRGSQYKTPDHNKLTLRRNQAYFDYAKRG